MPSNAYDVAVSPDFADPSSDDFGGTVSTILSIYEGVTMSEQENVALVRRAYQAFNEGDGAHLSQFLAEDCVQHMPGTGRFGGDQKGRDAVLGMYGQMGELSNGTMRAVPEAFFGNGDYVTVIHREQATRNGRTLDDRMCLLFRLENGQAVELTDMPENGASDETFWD